MIWWKVVKWLVKEVSVELFVLVMVDVEFIIGVIIELVDYGDFVVLVLVLGELVWVGVDGVDVVEFGFVVYWGMIVLLLVKSVFGGELFWVMLFLEVVLVIL